MSIPPSKFQFKLVYHPFKKHVKEGEGITEGIPLDTEEERQENATLKTLLKVSILADDQKI